MKNINKLTIRDIDHCDCEKLDTRYGGYGDSIIVGIRTRFFVFPDAPKVLWYCPDGYRFGSVKEGEMMIRIPPNPPA